MALKEELAEREQELLAHMNIHAHTTEEITKEAEEGKQEMNAFRSCLRYSNPSVS